MRLRRFQASLAIRSVGPAGVNFFPIYGQSLAVGGNADIISSAERDHSYMFGCGVRPQYNDTISVTDPWTWYTSLVAAKEQDDDTSNDHHETPCLGCADMVHQLILAENGAPAAAAYKTLVSAPGYGGLSLAQLSLGGTHFSRLACQADYGLIRSSIAGKTFATQAIGWTQGEQDYALGTTRAAYRAALATLITQFGNAAKAGKQDWTPPLVYGQIASHLALSVATPTIALAQDDAETLDLAGIACACPQYIFDYSVADYLHIGSPSTRWLGAYIGLTAKRRTYDGLSTWGGAMRIVSAVRNGDGIDVTLDPSGALAFDTTWVTALADGNYGFQVVDSAADPVAVTGVTITGATTVRVACSTGGGAGSVLRYGWAGTAGQSGRASGARGNLRDSYGDTLTFEVDTGDVRPMHRWLRISEVATA